MSTEVKRPNGALVHPEKFNKFFKLLDAKKINEADEFIECLEVDNNIESMWKPYCSGILFFKKEEFDEGNDFFQECKNAFDSLENKDSSAYRLLSMALKKLGWYQRHMKNFSEAYKIHEEEFNILLNHGSYKELHDATISLDVDSYYLKDLENSELWLRKSLEFGEKIVDDLTRVRSLAMSTNNLSGTLCGLKKFKEAFEFVEKSLELWKEFETINSANKEFRVAWALFAKADIYEQWAVSCNDESDSNSDKAKLLGLALESFESGLEIGINSDMPEKGQQFFNDRIKKNKALIES